MSRVKMQMMDRVFMSSMLSAIIMAGLGGGHYSAYAKLVEEDRWYHFDDAHVTPVSESDIRTSAAYLLFYQRVKKSKKR
ncbi:hypothetical protein LXL04_014768 [Taraxacum kok-saghyz]